MSISSQLLILNQTKENIKTSINNKGVSVTDEPFAEYPDKVRLIPNGGGIYESNIIQFIEGTMRNAVIPSGTTTIADWAFYNGDNGRANKLASVTIPNTVTTIGKHAFFGQLYLTSITIPASVTSIGDTAFYECVNMREMIFQSTVPPTLGGAAISTTTDTTIYYVPDDSLLAYQTAETWSYYSNRIKPISERVQ